MELINNHKENTRFIKFALVGISGTFVDFGFFNLFIYLFRLLDFNGFFALDAVVIASVFSFVIAVFNNYYWNRNWTYPESKQYSHVDQFLKFSTVSVIGLLIRTPLFAWVKAPVTQWVSEMIGGHFIISSITIGQNIALAAVIVIVLFWNYFANRFWTYKRI